MWMRILPRTRLVGLVGGLFVIAVRFMVGRGCVLGARVVNGVGELLCVFRRWEKCIWASWIYLRSKRGVWGIGDGFFFIVAYVHPQCCDILIL